MALIPEIRKKIDDWLSGEPSRSVSELARAARVPYSTLRRILQDEVTPNYSTLANILEVAASGCKLGPILTKQYPEMSNVFSLFTSGCASGIQMTSLDQDDLYLLAYLTCDRSVPVEEVKTEFGNRGLRSLKVLRSRKLVEISENDDMINALIPDFSFHHVDDILKVLKAHVEFTNSDNLTSSNGVAGVLWGSMSLDGYKKAINILENAAVAIGEIRKNSPGNVPVHFGYIMNSYNDLSPIDKKGDRDEI